jgi:PAS domain S-box-containing protein
MGNEIEVRDVDIVVSKSDEEGVITYGNPIFFKLSGYDKSELVGSPHSILRHPDMPKTIFAFLWEALKANKEVKTFVKNRSKNGDFYKVFAVIRPALNPDGSLRNYTSTRKRSNPKAWEYIEPFYRKLREIEESEGIEKAKEEVLNFVKEHGGSSLDDFNEVMEKLQKAQ